MLKRFAVENYRGFRDRVEMDLSKVRNYSFHSECIKGGLVNKCMILGRNGCGKTNFALALFDIVYVLTDFRSDVNRKDASGFLNGDSDAPYATFLYVFNFGSSDVEYEYRKSSPNVIVSERLSVGGDVVFVREGQDADYSGLEEYGAGDLWIDIRNGALSVLRYIANNTCQQDGSPISAIMDFVRGMLYVQSIEGGDRHIGLTYGTESPQDYIVRNGFVDDFRRFLNELAGSDLDLSIAAIVGCPQRMVIRTKNKMLDFEDSASRGTRMLMLHYYWMKHLKDVTFMYLDEFDAYYHFEPAEKVLVHFLKDPGFQCVFTSNNTALVSNRIMRPDCYLVMDSRGITALPDLTDREIREGNNLEKLLRGGEFDM